MSMLRPPGLGRAPKYRGKFGIPDDIINTPQKPAQWWAVALLTLLLALPFGLWGILEEAETLVMAGYFVLAGLTLLNAWFLRNDINETVPYLSFAMASGVIVLLAALVTAGVEAFPEGDWVAGILLVAAALIVLHNVYRAWQGLLIIGVFTEQETPPDSPYYKGT